MEKSEGDKISLQSSESEVEPEFIPTFNETITNLKYDKKITLKNC